MALCNSQINLSFVYNNFSEKLKKAIAYKEFLNIKSRKIGKLLELIIFKNKQE
ncbi:conserved hypothetical protein (plasmid) [Borreliella afzelii PKo]|uniref:Uncharacterized protein n=1 Tax=Borreliella afzelii (strain PKo) TaxID=390236 RepID=Q0SLK5_BORAP|nr:hypothetical protein BAPKO_3017 [Borreliella afzelii PKo]AEL70599.1 conserved hypothetical protein [Borreliella afzelii PKo]